jgi:hypothetical protein
MKTSVYRQAALSLLFFFAFYGNSFAQSSNFLHLQSPKFPIPEYREDNMGNKTTSVPLVSSKALNAFREMYKGVSDIQWFELDDKFLVKFKKDNRENSALFNAKGMHIYTISYGSEKHIPSEIRQRIRSTYFDFQITLVAEVNSMGKTAWIVKLEDKKSIIIVKVVDDEMEETENFLKPK